MSDIDEIVDEAIIDASLEAGEVIELPRDEAEAIYGKAKDKFVEDNPRVWWLRLKHKPISLDTDNSDEFLYLRNNWPPGEERCYFIPENESELPRVFDVTLKGLLGILRNSSFFEYYLVGKSLEWLIIENDHNELLIIRKTS